MKPCRNCLVALLLIVATDFALVPDCFSQEIENINLKKPVEFHGNLNLQLEYYHANGILPRKKDFSWLTSGNPIVTLFGVDLPLSFVLSNFENRFYQPFNQFGLSPHYKWVTLHLGYRNINFSQYTLAGYRMLGAGFELTPGKFRIGFMYGRLKRSTSIDSSMLSNPSYLRLVPAFKRLGIAGKIGYGTQKNYVDLVYFKAWDKQSSLNTKLIDSIQPAENTTIGLTSKVTFLKDLTWMADIGLSAYTLNRNDEKDTGSASKGWSRSLMNFLVKDRLSTDYYVAGETRLGYQAEKWGAQLAYKRIDPEYQSMGAYFFQNDIQEINLANNFRIDSGKLRINTTIGFQKDNLKKQKTSTSKRFISNANINYNPTQKFGIAMNYSNYGITNNPLKTSPGSELFKQVNNSVMIMPYFTWMNDRVIRNLNIVGTYQSLSTPQSQQGNVSDMNTWSLTTTYNHTWIQKGINANAAVNYINTKTLAGDITNYGGTVGGMIPLFERKVVANASATYMSNLFEYKNNGNTMTITGGVTVPVGIHHNFQLLANYMNNKSVNTLVIQSFNELSIQFVYGYNF